MRPRLVAGCTALALSCSTVLGGCAHQAGTGLARLACGHVELALAAEREAALAGAPQAAHLRAVALDQVRSALPLAALAAGQNTTWQALEATLSESNRVPLHYLSRALTAQCSSSSGVG